ncbi:MAG: hypothetical protein OHK0013_27430 [Sandaracinaceae bacterium]
MAGARLVWLAVPDPALPEVAERVASHLRVLPPRARRPVVVHASGATSPSVLAPCRGAGAPIAAAHPLVSFGTPHTALAGASFVLAGDAPAVRAVAAMVRKLGARPVHALLHGPRYHAAAALLANGSAALAALAVDALVREGLSEQVAARSIGALLRSVADNVVRVGPTRALTGPIARGDAAAVARHLAALEASAQDDYRAVSRIVLRAAEAAGLDAERAGAIRALLERRFDRCSSG